MNLSRTTYSPHYPYGLSALLDAQKQAAIIITAVIVNILTNYYQSLVVLLYLVFINNNLTLKR